MKISQLQENLNRLFYQDNNRLIFWYDPDQEFIESIPELELDGVTVLRMDQWGSLELKIKLEKEDPENKYLIYSPASESINRAHGGKNGFFIQNARMCILEIDQV